MQRSNELPESSGTVGSLRCKGCDGVVFSVANLEDQTPITCDQCGAVVGRRADVRALTGIPEKEVMDRTGGDIFESSYRGLAQLSCIGID